MGCLGATFYYFVWWNHPNIISKRNFISIFQKNYTPKHPINVLNCVALASGFRMDQILWIGKKINFNFNFFIHNNIKKS
jgi:hypothetical protein